MACRIKAKKTPAFTFPRSVWTGGRPDLEPSHDSVAATLGTASRAGDTVDLDEITRCMRFPVRNELPNAHRSRIGCGTS